MTRGNNTPQRGRGTPRGGRGGGRGGGSGRGTPRGSGFNTPRGRGRGRGGWGGSSAHWEIEYEAQQVMATLGIPYDSPYRGRGGPNSQAGRGGRGRGFQPFIPKPKRGGGLGYRQIPDDSPPYAWSRPTPSRPNAAGRRADGRDRPLLQPIVFVRSGTLFENKDDLLKPEVRDVDEGQEETAQWLQKAFERAQEIEAQREAAELEELGAEELVSGMSGTQTPGDGLEELVAQAVMPGVFLQAQTRTSVALDSTPAAKEEEDLESEEEDKVVYVAPAQKMVNISETTAVPTMSAPEAVEQATSELPVVTVVAETQPTPDPTPLPVPEAQLPALDPAIISVSLPHSVDPSRAPTPPTLMNPFPSAPALSSLLARFKASPSVRSPAEGTASAASTPALASGALTPVEAELGEKVQGQQVEGNAEAESSRVVDAVTALLEDVTTPPVPEANQREAGPSAEPVELAVPVSPTFPFPTGSKEVPSFASFTFSSSFSPRKAAESPAQDKGKGKAKKPLKRKEIKRLRRAAARRRTRMSMPCGEEEGAPRIGDSDLEWGSDGPPVRVPGEPGQADSDEESDEDGNAAFTAAADGLVHAMGGMDMDDLEEDALARFALSVGAGQMSIADLDVEEEWKREKGDRDSSGSDEDDSDEEDEDEEDDSESDEFEAELREVEKQLVGESDEDSEDDDDEEDDEPVAGPSGGFKARLARAAAKGAAKKSKWRLNYDEEDKEDTDDAALFEGNLAWKDDGDLIEEIQAVLDDNQDILTGRDRKSRKKLFSAIRDGEFAGLIDEDDDLFLSSMVKSKKKKRNDLPPELQILWDKDRAKKAEYKRLRALERKEREATLFKSRKDKNKKDWKAKFDDPESTFEPKYEEITDMYSLERMIRLFLQDKNKMTLALPAMEKESRRRVHLLAECFKLKSQSKGNGVGRYPMLIKTTRSGTNNDEEKIARILDACKEAGMDSNMAAFNRAYYRKKDKGASKGTARHVEGQIVGEKAAKIGESNVGYKMLQLMGWSEGDRIGLQDNGIIDPLTARIKRTKLGLGAAF